MVTKFIKEAAGWGFLLWLFGYLLGILLFFVVPVQFIGWVILPFGTGLTLFVLFKKIKSATPQYYFSIGVVWVLLAVILDYLFIIKLLNPSDGYYKLDVYLYYVFTLLFPVIVGLKNRNPKKVIFLDY